MTAAGYPETDLFRVNLSRAVIREDAQSPAPAQEPAITDLRTIFDAIPGTGTLDHLCHGRLLRCRGTVQSVPSPESAQRRLLLACGPFKLPVDLGLHPETAADLALGTEIEVTGRCLLEIDNWRPDDIFPRIRNLVAVIRSPDDIRILARPPWWTPNRLLLMLGLLLVVVIAIVIWNTLLRRAIARRSTELESEISARIGANLKVYERTRLAVELHDTISQNLTGVAMRLRTAAIVAESNPPAVVQQIALAGMTLDACREDLRNCLWDLRNLTLDEENVDEAIRKTLAPHIEDAELHVRFRVPRERMSDNTTHTIFSIVRELAVNAVRHGHATQIRVAGAIDGAQLKFSVADNGCGFDPDTRPGMAEGHFGLQGIQERLKQFGGSLSISSASGQGSKFTASLALPRKDKQL